MIYLMWFLIFAWFFTSCTVMLLSHYDDWPEWCKRVAAGVVVLAMLAWLAGGIFAAVAVLVLSAICAVTCTLWFALFDADPTDWRTPRPNIAARPRDEQAEREAREADEADYQKRLAASVARMRPELQATWVAPQRDQSK